MFDAVAVDAADDDDDNDDEVWSSPNYSFCYSYKLNLRRLNSLNHF